MAARTRIVAVVLALRVLLASSEPLGCFVENWVKPTGAYVDNMTVLNATECQLVCQADPACDNFGFYTASLSCWLGSNGSESYVKAAAPAIAGPKTCDPSKSGCNAAVAPQNWPLADEVSSMAAWPGQFQPKKLACITESCPFSVGSNITVLDDTANGWPGTCTGLTEFTSLLGQNETCEESCRNNVSCPVYQVGLDGTCWQGIGVDCTVPPVWNQTFAPTEAKRFSRGEVRVMRDLVDVQIMDLMRVFGAEELATLGQDKAIVECRHACYSIYGCEYWQLSNITSTGGCWVEPPTDPVIYPLYRDWDGLVDTSTLAGFMIAGEYIQRFCPEVEEPAVVVVDEPAVVEEGDEELPMPLWLIGAILAGLVCLIGLCIGVCIHLGICCKKKTGRGLKSKKKRGAKPLVQSQSPGANTSLFDQIDRNHDGVITKEEFMRSVQVMPVMPGVAPQPMQAVAMPQPMQAVAMPAMQVAQQQPVPTVAMPMATYQVAEPALVAAPQMTYAAPPMATGSVAVPGSAAVPAVMSAPGVLVSGAAPAPTYAFAP